MPGNSICVRELAAFGKYSASLGEEGSFRLSKPSFKPRNVTLQFDAAGASWGLKGLSSASNKIEKKALVKTMVLLAVKTS